MSRDGVRGDSNLSSSPAERKPYVPGATERELPAVEDLRAERESQPDWDSEPVTSQFQLADLHHGEMVRRDRGVLIREDGPSAGQPTH